jgi:hypothetical protein
MLHSLIPYHRGHEAHEVLLQSDHSSLVTDHSRHYGAAKRGSRMAERSERLRVLKRSALISEAIRPSVGECWRRDKAKWTTP